MNEEVRHPAGATDGLERPIPRVRGLSLELKVPLLITALLVVLLSVTVALSYREIEASALTAGDERLERVAMQLAGLVENAVNARLADLATAAASDHVRAVVTGRAAPDTARLTEAFASLAAPRDPLRRVVLLDADRQPILSWGGTPEVAARYDVGEGIFPPGGGYGHWIDAGGRILTPAAAAIRDDQEILGYVLHIRPFGSQALAEQVGELIGLEAHVYFVEDTGVWMTLTGTPAEPANADLSSGTLAFRRSDGVDYLARTAPIAGTPWVLLAELPLDFILRRPSDFLRRLGALLLLMMALGAAGAWLLSRRFTAPLLQLSGAAGTFASGDYSHRVDLDRSDELGVLAASFNSMAEQVQVSDAELKRQVDEARRLANELEGANARLRSLMAEAESARQSAEAANRAKSDFLATVTHEIRTPINAIIGYTDLLLLGVPSPPSPQQVQQLERVRESGNRLIRLIEDVLDLAKIEAGKLDVNATVGVVEEAIHAALRMTEPLSLAKRVEVVTTADPFGRTAYYGDPGRVEQIVANLLGNAVKFTPTGGRVEVTCDHGPGSNGAAKSPVVRVTVRDNGPGIPPEKQELIFERFVQGESGYRRSYEGAGLGLAISRELARLMGGDIRVESEMGAGAAFILLLPAARSGRAPSHEGVGPRAD